MKYNGLLNGKVILVTGGSGGIGSAICKKAAEQGATVIIHYNSKPERAEELRRSIECLNGESMIVQADLSVNKDVTKMFQDIINKYGGIDILVNNAGRSFNALVTLTTEEQWQMVLDINLKSVFLCSKRFIFECIKRKRAGVILNISSVAGLGGSVGMGAYSASKAGVNSLTRTLAKEYANKNIRVNVIAPGPVDTDMMANVPQNLTQTIINEVPLGRIAKPDEIAELAIFLSSDLASYITGAIIPVDGGQTS